MRIGSAAAWRAWFGGKRAPGWICAFLLLFVCCLVLPAYRSELAVKWASVIFQWCGISLVVIGVSNTLRERGQPGMYQAFKSYLAQVPFRTTDVQGRMEARETGSDTCTATGQAISSLVDDSLDTLRTRFVEYMNETNRALVEANAKIGVLERSLLSSVEQLEKARAQDMARMRHELTEGLVGSYAQSVVGAVYLAVGAVLGTFPAEIACRLPAWWA